MRKGSKPFRKALCPIRLIASRSPPHSVSLPASSPWPARGDAGPVKTGPVTLGIPAWPHPQVDAAGERTLEFSLPALGPFSPSAPQRGAAAKDASTPGRACTEKDRMRGASAAAEEKKSSRAGIIRPPPAPAAPKPAGSCAGGGRSRHGPAAPRRAPPCHSPCSAPSHKAGSSSQAPA
jgi:hypothetical protein